MKVYAAYLELQYDNGDYMSMYSTHAIGASHEDAFENAFKYISPEEDEIMYESYGEFDSVEDACAFIYCECFHVDDADSVDVDAAWNYTLGDRIQAGIYC